MSDKKPCQQMDPRCPRHLENMPDTWCPLAVMRLKAIRTAGRELSEEEEEKLPGCPWAVNHQLAGYCFFKYINDYTGDKPPSDVEIASLLGVSVDTVKGTEKKALNKLSEVEEYTEIREAYDNESPYSEIDSDADYSVRRK